MRVVVRYFEQGRPTMEMKVKLPPTWEASQLVERFAAAYAQRYPKASVLDPASYGLVVLNTREAVGRLGDLEDEAMLGLVPVIEPPTPAEATEDDFELFCEAAWLAMHQPERSTDRVVAYLRMKKRLRQAMHRRHQEDDEPSPEINAAASSESEESDAAADDDSDSESSSSGEPSGARQRVSSEAKDWGRINYRKALCPHVLAGRRCPKGSECAYAHVSGQVRVERRLRPGVCADVSTADFKLPLPALWQLGVFAETRRQQPNLWARMTRRDRAPAAEKIRRRRPRAQEPRGLSPAVARTSAGVSSNN